MHLVAYPQPFDLVAHTGELSLFETQDAVAKATQLAARARTACLE
jgi:hypothetical protein